MQLMTMLAISLLAGFAAGGLVWVVWSVIENVQARRSSAAAMPEGVGDKKEKEKRSAPDKAAKNGKASLK